ncbi:tetratricopeptide repeat protein [Candidatus Bipolaricaulota bacterium]
MSTDAPRTLEEQGVFVRESLKRADALRKNKEYDQAISLLVEALRYGLEKANIYYQLGNVYVDGGDLDRAEYAYNRALEVDPNLVNAMHNLAIVYRRQKRMSLYVKTFKKSQRLSIKSSRKTRPGTDQKTRIRGTSRSVSVWLFGGAAVIALFVWLLTR